MEICYGQRQNVCRRWGTQLSKEDNREVGEMAGILESMLEKIHQGFLNRDVEAAGWVLQTDARIDEACCANFSFFRRHLEKTDRREREYSTNLLFIAQAFERAGDHAKNLAEEIFQLVAGCSPLCMKLKRRSPGASKCGNFGTDKSGSGQGAFTDGSFLDLLMKAKL